MFYPRSVIQSIETVKIMLHIPQLLKVKRAEIKSIILAESSVARLGLSSTGCVWLLPSFILLFYHSTKTWQENKMRDKFRRVSLKKKKSKTVKCTGWNNANITDLEKCCLCQRLILRQYRNGLNVLIC